MKRPRKRETLAERHARNSAAHAAASEALRGPGRPAPPGTYEALAAQRARDRPYLRKKQIPPWSPENPSVRPPPPPPAPFAPLAVLEKTVLAAAEQGVAPAFSDSNSAAFQELLGLSLKSALEVMNLELDPTDKNFAKLLSTKQSIMSSVFSTTARIDAALMRRQETDEMDAVLGDLEEEQRKLAARRGEPVEDDETRLLREMGML